MHGDFDSCAAMRPRQRLPLAWAARMALAPSVGAPAQTAWLLCGNWRWTCASSFHRNPLSADTATRGSRRATHCFVTWRGASKRSRNGRQHSQSPGRAAARWETPVHRAHRHRATVMVHGLPMAMPCRPPSTSSTLPLCRSPPRTVCRLALVHLPATWTSTAKDCQTDGPSSGVQRRDGPTISDGPSRRSPYGSGQSESPSAQSPQFDGPCALGFSPWGFGQD